jgi:hypothetical protein
MTEKITKPKKEAVDWDALEPHYRAGIRSLKDLGAEYGCSDAAIVKHAKKNGWTRNLAAKIAAKAEAKVSAAAVSAEVSAQRAANQEQVVEANAQLQYQIRMEHRQDIKASRELFQKLLSEVRGITDHPDLCEELFDLLYAKEGEASGDDPKAVMREQDRLFKLRQAFERVMSIGGRVDAAKKLSEMLEKLIKMEREAFGIKSSEEDQATPIDELLHKIAREREGKRS